MSGPGRGARRGDRMNLFGVDRLNLHTRGCRALASGLTAQRLQLRRLYRGARVLLAVFAVSRQTEPHSAVERVWQLPDDSQEQQEAQRLSGHCYC